MVIKFATAHQSPICQGWRFKTHGKKFLCQNPAYLKVLVQLNLWLIKGQKICTIHCPFFQKRKQKYSPTCKNIQIFRTFTSLSTRSKINSHFQSFRYGRSILCLPHWPKFLDFFDLCLHWVSVVRVLKSHDSLFTEIPGDHFHLEFSFC